jgi:hypothetical protein
MVTNLISVKAIRAIIDKEDPAVKEQIEVVIAKVMAEKESRRRQPRPPAPEGGISLSEGSRKYGIPHPTISRWVKYGYISIKRDDGWIIYIDEAKLKVLATVYKSDPGRGSWAIKKYHQEHTN